MLKLYLVLTSHSISFMFNDILLFLCQDTPVWILCIKNEKNSYIIQDVSPGYAHTGKFKHWKLSDKCVVCRQIECSLNLWTCGITRRSQIRWLFKMDFFDRFSYRSAHLQHIEHSPLSVLSHARTKPMTKYWRRSLVTIL